MQTLRNNKSRIVGVRFTPEEFERLRQAAEVAEQELSTYVRVQVVKVDAPRYARRKSLDRELLGKLLVELNRIGSNINQVVRVANRTGFASVYQDALADRTQLEAAVRAVLKTLE